MRLLFLFSLFLIPYLALSADEKPSPDSVLISQDAVQEEHTPESVISEFLREVKQKSPVLYAQWEQLPDQELINRVFSGLNGRKTSAASGAKAQTEAEIHYAVSIAKNKILYVRVESLTKKAVQRLMEDCTNAGLLRLHRPVCLILDFRIADGGDHDQIPVLLEYFTNEKNSYFRERPVAILTSGQTSGPAELLTVLLEKALPRCITVGAPGCGKLFPETVISIRGQNFSIPVIPQKWSSIPPLPHTPMMRQETEPMVKMSDLGNGEALQKDPAIRCAMDMLFAIHAVK